MAEIASGINTTIGTLLPETSEPENRLIEAMRYATLGGGKRIRPFLVCESAKLFGVDHLRAKPGAAAPATGRTPHANRPVSGRSRNAACSRCSR